MWNIIRKGSVLPTDFLNSDGTVNRNKYIVEFGFKEENEWNNEYLFSPTLEIVGAIIMGSKNYNDIRYRQRIDGDEPYNIQNNFVYRLYNIAL